MAKDKKTDDTANLTEWQKRNLEFLKKKKNEELEQKKRQEALRLKRRSEFKKDDASTAESVSQAKKKPKKKKPKKIKVKKVKTPKQKAWRYASPLLLVSFLVLALSLFLLTPYSKKKTLTVTGETYTTSEDVLTTSGISESDYVFSIALHHKDYEEAIVANNAWVKSATITYNFPNHFTIAVEEYAIVGYAQTDGGYQPIRENGTRGSVVSSAALPETFLTINLTDEDAIQTLIKTLNKLDDSLVSQIQTVSSAESTTTSDLLLLTMQDGNQVRVPLSELLTKLPYYTNIAASLTETSIIDMEVGIYTTTATIESEMATKKAEEQAATAASEETSDTAESSDENAEATSSDEATVDTDISSEE